MVCVAISPFFLVTIFIVCFIGWISTNISSKIAFIFRNGNCDSTRPVLNVHFNANHCHTSAANIDGLETEIILINLNKQNDELASDRERMDVSKLFQIFKRGGTAYCTT